jgi:hypothetical protein
MILSQGKWRCAPVCHLAGWETYFQSEYVAEIQGNIIKKLLLEKQHQIRSKLFTFNGFIAMAAATHLLWVTVYFLSFRPRFQGLRVDFTF